MKTSETTTRSEFDFTRGLDLLTKLVDDPDAVVAVDTETTGLKVADGSNYVIGISIATQLSSGEYASAYYPVRHLVGENIDPLTRVQLHQVLTSHDLILANVQFDMLGLHHVGLDCRQSTFYDIFTMGNLIDENSPIVISLNSLALVYLGEGQAKVDDPFVEKEKKSGNQNIDAAQMEEYAIVDAELTWRVWDQMIHHPEWIYLSEQTDIWEVKQDSIRVLMAMRLRGITVDINVATELEALGTQKMAEYTELLGINPGSHKDLQELFIDKLKFPVVKKSKKTGSPSFDKDAMEIYDAYLEKADNPLAKNIKAYRGWQKATTACFRPYLALVDADGRLRCTFNTHRTVTGRLSSSDPNLQQIPKETDKEWSGRTKECFVASPGFTLLSADYSQLELRLAASYAGEEKLLQIFEENRDLFSEMAADMAMTRPDTKTFVYSIQYGAGVDKTAMTFRVTKVQAIKMRNRYKAAYPRMAWLNDHCMRQAETNLKVTLWSGRYRHFKYKSEAYKAMNSVIQGGAADIVERIMVKAYRLLESDDCHLLLQVHDALVFEVRQGMEDKYAGQIKSIMEDVNSIIPPHIHATFDAKFNVEVSNWVK